MRVFEFRWLWFGLSAVVIALGVAALAIFGLRVGVDFRGGLVFEVAFEKPTTREEVRTALDSLNLPDLRIAPAGEHRFLIKTSPISKEAESALKTSLREKLGAFREIRLESLGPAISGELIRRGVVAVILASIALIAYIWYAFRTIPPPYSSLKFGLVAVATLLHDVAGAVGLFALTSRFLDVEIDSSFIAALLTIMGFSVHDTIVVFDRLRENLRRFPGESLVTIANASVGETAIRSLNTSLTTLLAAAALLVLGGVGIRSFALLLSFGIVVGTYSSIFVATPLVVLWEKNK